MNYELVNNRQLPPIPAYPIKEPEEFKDVQFKEPVDRNIQQQDLNVNQDESFERNQIPEAPIQEESGKRKRKKRKVKSPGNITSSLNKPFPDQILQEDQLKEENKSPPVPALRKKLSLQASDTNPFGQQYSPPLPALMKKITHTE